MDDTIENARLVGELVLKFYKHGNLSMVDLIRRTGYPRWAESITEKSLIDFLKLNPNVTESWLRYSEDQRCSPAWFIVEPGYLGNTSWAVGRVEPDGETAILGQYESMFAACAAFIKLEADKLAELAACSKLSDGLYRTPQ